MSNRFQNRYAAGGLFGVIGLIMFGFAFLAHAQDASQADHLNAIRLRGVDVTVIVNKVHFATGDQTAPMTLDIEPLAGTPRGDLPTAVQVGPNYGRYMLRQVGSTYSLLARSDDPPPTMTLRHLPGEAQYLPVDDADAWIAPKESMTGLVVFGCLMLALGTLVFLFYDRIAPRKPAA